MRLFRPTVVSLLLLLSCASAALADPVDDYIHQRLSAEHIPGLSLVIVRDGHIVKSQGYGLENIETGTPASAATVYRLASLSKQFTAAAILLLVQDGKLSLDDKVSRFLQPSPPLWAGITLRQLLTHTSGIKDYLNELHVGTCNGTSETELIGGIGPLPLNFPPATQESYSNTNYLVLGAVIRNVTGKSYDAFLHDRVFAPLGMTHTFRTDTVAIVPHRAAGYLWTGSALQNAPALAPTVYGNADAGLMSTVEDLTRWDAALASGKLLRSDLQAAMFQPVKLADGSEAPYGFGWETGGAGPTRFVAHDGLLAGFSTYIVRYLGQNLTIILLANRSDILPAHLARHIATLVDPALGATGPGPGEVPAVSATMRSVLQGIQNGKVDDNLFAPEMWAHGDRDETVHALQHLFASMGRLGTITFVSAEGPPGKRRYVYEASFGDSAMLADFTLNANGKILSMGIGSE